MYAIHHEAHPTVFGREYLENAARSSATIAHVDFRTCPSSPARAVWEFARPSSSGYAGVGWDMEGPKGPPLLPDLRTPTSQGNAAPEICVLKAVLIDSDI